MAVDIFLKVNGIDGESTDDIHKNEIDVISWSWGMDQSGTTHMGPGGGSGKVHIHDMSFTKYSDKATNNLMKACCNGKHIADATLYVRKAGGDAQVEYIVIEMKDIMVTSYVTGGSQDDQDRIIESVVLNFAEFKFTYTEQTKEGTAGASSSAGWNAALNKAV